nr:DNA-directed DNA polymerase [Tanacetum cinerariifolium]
NANPPPINNRPFQSAAQCARAVQEIQVMDDLDITMEEYIQRMANRAQGHDQTFNWEIATYNNVNCDDFSLFTYSAIVYSDAPTSNHNVSSDPLDLPVPDLRTIEELCQPSLNGRSGPIAPIAIQEMNFGLKNDMIQQSIKVNGVTEDALCLYLFPHSLTHHATAWFDRLPRNSINTFEQMAKMFLEKYFPPSMVTKLRNKIPNFRQRPDESLFEAWERGTFMKRRPEECYDLIENMTAHHNDWDTSAQWSESSSSISSSFDTKIAALKAKMAEINKNLMKGANQGLNQPQAYQAPAYQALVHQPHIPQPQVVTTNEFTNFMKENDAILKNMQTSMTSLTNSNLELKNMFGQFMKMNTALCLGSRTLPGNTITNPKEDLKGITTRRGTAYPGPMIPTTYSFAVVECETEETKNTFGPSIKSLLTNKDKLCELARTPLNEHCSVVLLKKFPKKLGDPDKFLIPCDFPRMAECLALVDLCVSINLMPLSMWNKLSLPDFSPTCMTLELVDRSISYLVGIAEDVFVKVGTFHFPDDFVVVDFDDDPRVPLILERSFLKTERALIDVFEEVDAFLALEDDPTSPEVDQSYLDSKGDILLLEAFLNDEPSLPPLNQGNYLPEVCKELKICEAKSNKSSIDEPLEVELKDLPPHLEYAFLEGDDKLPVIITKDLSMEEKTAHITVLKSHKRAIAWKLSDIKGIDPEFCTHKILMEEDFEPVVQHQRRVNPKIYNVIKNEVLKLLDARLIYPIFDSPWVSPVHCVPKKGGFIVVENEENELISTYLVMGWRVCIDYRKLNEATHKDHFPLHFMDQMLERLEGNQYYYFLDGFSGYFQIPIDLNDLEKTTFTYPYRTFAYRRMPFGLCNAPGTFQRCMMAIFHDMMEKTMEVFMVDFSVFRNSFQSCLFYLEKMLKRPIYYASKTMTEAESNYTTTEKEMLAVVYAFEKLWSYLIMNKRIVYTDHSALKYLFAKKDSKAILLHWVLLLQEFTFRVIVTKGS